MLRDKIVFSVHENIQQILMRENDLTLQKAIKICKAFEAARSNVQELQLPKPTVVCKVKTSRDQQDQRKSAQCNFCGRDHKRGRFNCLLERNKDCGARNHFNIVCKKKVQSVEQDDDVIRRRRRERAISVWTPYKVKSR